MMNIIYWKAIALFMTGHALSWFQLNSHMVFDWWKGKEYLAVLGVWGACWLYVFVRLGNGSGRKRRTMDAQILGVLRLLGPPYFMGETFTWKQ